MSSSAQRGSSSPGRPRRAAFGTPEIASSSWGGSGGPGPSSGNLNDSSSGGGGPGGGGGSKRGSESSKRGSSISMASAGSHRLSGSMPLAEDPFKSLLPEPKSPRAPPRGSGGAGGLMATSKSVQEWLDLASPMASFVGEDSCRSNRSERYSYGRVISVGSDTEEAAVEKLHTMPEPMSRGITGGAGMRALLDEQRRMQESMSRGMHDIRLMMTQQHARTLAELASIPELMKAAGFLDASPTLSPHHIMRSAHMVAEQGRRISTSSHRLPVHPRNSNVASLVHSLQSLPPFHCGSEEGGPEAKHRNSQQQREQPEFTRGGSSPSVTGVNADGTDSIIMVTCQEGDSLEAVQNVIPGAVPDERRSSLGMGRDGSAGKPMVHFASDRMMSQKSSMTANRSLWIEQEIKDADQRRKKRGHSIVQEESQEADQSPDTTSNSPRSASVRRHSAEVKKNRRAGNGVRRSITTPSGISQMDLFYEPRFCEEVVRSKSFAFASTAVIVINTLLILVDANAAVQLQIGTAERTHEVEQVLTALQLVFCVIFAIELTMRFIADWRVIRRAWNILDVVLIPLSFAVLVGRLSGEGSFQYFPNFSFARVLRLASTLRETEVEAIVQRIHHFRMMLVVIRGSLVQLFWALLLLLFIMSVFALIFVQAVAGHLYFEDGKVDDKVSYLTTHFGSLSQAILTLFASVAGGIDWEQVTEPLGRISNVYVVLFAGYICFVMIGVLNVVTGVFVDHAWQMAQADRELKVQSEMTQKEKYMHELRALFHDFDQEKSGSLSWAQFERNLKDDRVKAYLATLELDVAQAHGLFRLLDVMGSNAVCIDDFVAGCMRLKGNAKSIDVCTLLYETRTVAREWSNFNKSTQEKLARIEEALNLSPPTPMEQLSSITWGAREHFRRRTVSGQTWDCEYSVISPHRDLALSGGSGTNSRPWSAQ